MKNKSILIYYAILLLIVALRTSEMAPNILVRVAFLLVFFLPIVIKYQYLLPACLTCFMTVGTYGFAYNYFPYQMEIYPVICGMGMFFIAKSITLGKSRNNAILFLILFFVLIRDVIDDGSPQPLFYSFLTIICMLAYVKDNKEKAGYYLLNCFVIAALVISILYFINYDKFLASYSIVDDVERSGWTDPNYLSCIIGMAVVSSAILFQTQTNARMLEKVLWIISSVLAFVAQLLLASRGGLLAVIVVLVFLFIKSKTKLRHKILIMALFIIVMMVLYQMGYFSLIEYRIVNDGGGGSGRTDIWVDKLSYFTNSTNFFQIIFGMGPVSALNIGNNYVAFHNDFIAILCGYGILGLLAFIYLLISPILVCSKTNRTVVTALIIYLVMCSVTLEPFYSGRLTYFSLYLLAYLITLYKPQID